MITTTMTPWRHLGGAVGQSWVKSRKQKEVLLTLPTYVTKLMWTFRSLSSHFIFILYYFIVFPECVASSKGSRFTLGVWGLRVCSLDVAQPFATVCNRSREARMAVPMTSSATVVTFAGFQHRVASFCLAGVALQCNVSTLHTPHSTLHTLHFTLYTPHFTLHTPHFTLHTSHSTL